MLLQDFWPVLLLGAPALTRSGLRTRRRVAGVVLLAAVAVFAVLVLVGRYEVGGYRSLASQPVAVSALVLVSLGVCLSTLRADLAGGRCRSSSSR